MLKIREDFNLKELEKYGFEKVPCGDYLETFQDDMSGAVNIRIFYDKMVYPVSDLDLYNRGNSNEVKMFDTLYDLIKADIVIKE